MSPENAEEVFDNIASTLVDLEEDEQSEENLILIVEVFEQIDNLISSDRFNVTNNVS